MKEIEIGEYVRTDKGKIGKVVEKRLGFNKDLQVYQDIYKLDNGLWTILDYIVKHSKQLIDLIEEGDYVNGHLVEEVRISCFDSSIFVCFENVFLFFCMQFCQKFVFLFYFKKRVSSIFYPLKI